MFQKIKIFINFKFLNLKCYKFTLFLIFAKIFMGLDQKYLDINSYLKNMKFIFIFKIKLSQ
jgi:hypothetical protein